MHPSLKNVTERAQKYDFSVNIPIYIAYNKSKPRHFVSESWHWTLLCFPLNIALKETFQLKNAP